MYTDGFLPEPGAVTDQPNNLMQAFQDISLAKGYLDNQDAQSNGDDDRPDTPEGYRSVIRRRD